METTYSVNGMTCEHCVRAVTSEVSKVPGVTDVKVDLAAETVVVKSESQPDAEAIAAAIDEAGYELSDSPAAP